MALLEQGDQTKSYLSKLVRSALNNPKAIGYQKLSITGTIANLTVPANATYAKLTLESADSGIAARYLEFGGTVTAVSVTDGLALVDLTTFDISDYANLVGFQIIRVQSGVTNLFVQYYQ
jgi:uncharacterized protein YjdB